MSLVPTLLFSLLAVVCTLAVVAAIRQIVRQRRLWETGVFATGTVMQPEEQPAPRGTTTPPPSQARVVFTTEAGQSVQLTVVSRACAQWTVGQEVTLIYDPCRPEVAAVGLPDEAGGAGGAVGAAVVFGLLAVFFVYLAFFSPGPRPATITVTVSPADVLHQEGARLRYPGSSVLGRAVEAGVSTLTAQYSRGHQLRSSRQFVGYSGSPVPGTEELLLAAPVRPAAITAWYRSWLLRHGWCHTGVASFPPDSSGTATIETYLRGGGWSDAHMEELMLISGAPRVVTALSRVPTRAAAPGAHTLFITRYSLYPADTSVFPRTGGASC